MDELDAVVYGMSFDTPAENLGFAEKMAFGFRLLSDPDRSAGKEFETRRPKGHPASRWARRITYIADPALTIRRSYRVIDVINHSDEVVSDLEALQSGLDSA